MLSRFFIDRPIFAWVIAIITMIGGALAAVNLPVRQYPAIAPPTVGINVNYAGSSAQTLQDTIPAFNKKSEGGGEVGISGLASSLGGFATLICKPSTMTHRGMPPEAQAEAGLHPDLLRLSVGLEDQDDLIADLGRGFAAI